MENNIALWIQTAATIVIAVFAFLTWKAYKRIEWFTGAYESHSAMSLRLQAKKENIKMLWWDPTKKASLLSQAR